MTIPQRLSINFILCFVGIGSHSKPTFKNRYSPILNYPLTLVAKIYKRASLRTLHHHVMISFDESQTKSPRVLTALALSLGVGVGWALGAGPSLHLPYIVSSPIIINF
jgi:hypothetical protein